MRHTPGPWTVGSHAPHRVFAGKGPECLQVADAFGREQFEDGANAHLIAAAPDLYAALKDFMDGAGDVHAKVLAARAALVKAEGR